jgi:hypothetical protein
VTFAFVRDAILQRGDIVSGLFPLFAPAIKRRTGQVFEPSVFARDLDELCGLSVHPYIIEDWAPRLAQQGFLIAEDTQTAGNSTFTKYTYANPDVQDAHDLEGPILGLFDAFEAYAKRLFGENSIATPGREELERELVARIGGMSFEDILGKPDRTSEASRLLTLEKAPVGPTPEQRAAQNMDVVCATFFLELKERHAETFRLVTDLAAGALGAQVVLSFRIPPKTGSSFKGKYVFLDSPLIMDMLDVGSHEDRDFARYLLSALKQEGAVVATFDHNVGEIIAVLTAANHKFEQHIEVTGIVGSRLRVDNNTMLRVKSILNNPQKKVKDLGIEVTEARAVDRPYLSLFDEKSEQNLISAIRPYHRIEAREVDAASISSMIRYLYGRRPKGGFMALEKLFVTKNTPLVRAANNYMRRLNGLEFRDSPILSDRAMAGTLWVATGGQGNELPLHKLLANCTAAVRPRGDVISKVRDVLRETSPEEAATFEAMIEDERCGYCLMQSTLGDANLVTGESTPRVLREMKRAMAVEITQQKDEEIARQREEHLKLVAELEDAHKVAMGEASAEAAAAAERVAQTAAELALAAKAADDARRRADDLETRLKALESRQEEAKRSVVSDAFERSRRTELFVYAAIIVPIAIILFWLGNVAGTVGTGQLIIAYAVFAALSLVQFAMFPDVLFGRLARYTRERAFRNRLRRIGLAEYENVLIDWKNKSVIFD